MTLPGPLRVFCYLATVASMFALIIAGDVPEYSRYVPWTMVAVLVSLGPLFAETLEVKSTFWKIVLSIFWPITFMVASVIGNIFLTRAMICACRGDMETARKLGKYHPGTY